MLSEKNQRQKLQTIISFIGDIQSGQIHRERKKISSLGTKGSDC